MNKGDKFDARFIVSQEVYQGFINVFHDRNPLHTDKDFAISKGFRAEVMHGNILNGFLSYFIGECLPSKDVIINAQTIKYIKPVYLNDVLHMSAEVTGIYESVKAVEFKIRFVNETGEKVATGTIQISMLK